MPFSILTGDPAVKAVFINIFGGYSALRYELATGVVAAASDLRHQGADRGPHGGHQRGGGSAGSYLIPDLISPWRRMLDARKGRRSWPTAKARDERTRQMGHASARTGIYRQEATFHSEQSIAYGTKIVGGVTPGKGGTQASRPARSSTPWRGRKGHRRERLAHFRTAALRGRRHHGSGRRRHPPGCLHHRRHSRCSTWCAWEFLKEQRNAPHRTQLPRHHFARQMQNRNHARHHPQGRQRRRRQPQRHAHLRSRRPAHAARHRPIHLHRHRRRSHHRHHFPGCASSCSTTIPKPTPSS